MKKIVIWAMCLVLALASGALAKEGSLNEELTEPVPVSVTIGPYAKIWVQRVEFDGNLLWWHFSEVTPPGMNFNPFSGEAGFGRFADGNCFLLETNTNVAVEFSGTALTHTGAGIEDTMLTRYWAAQSEGVDSGDEWWLFPPKQVRPVNAIGYFGPAGKAPRADNIPSWDDLDWILKVVANLLGYDLPLWPDENDHWSEAKNVSIDLQTGNGFYAFQVFGFVSTDEISSQRAGEYKATITATVSASN
jgi:hypothetical protein